MTRHMQLQCTLLKYIVKPLDIATDSQGMQCQCWYSLQSHTIFHNYSVVVNFVDCNFFMRNFHGVLSFVKSIKFNAPQIFTYMILNSANTPTTFVLQSSHMFQNESFTNQFWPYTIKQDIFTSANFHKTSHFAVEENFTR